ncbi:hypothetical protein FQZ97_1247460 [compost metagenome]
MAPSGCFSQEPVRASHQAMGVPISNSSRVVSEASLRVSRTASKSASARGIATTFIYSW